MPTLLSTLLAGAWLTCGPSVSPTSSAASLGEVAAEHACVAVAGRYDETRVSISHVSGVGGELVDAAPEAGATFEVGRVHHGQVAVTVSQPSESGGRVRGVLWFRVEGQVWAWTAAVDLRRETTVRRDLLLRRRVDLAALDLSRQDLLDDPEGTVVLKPIRRGAPLTVRHSREAPLVARRQRVSVLLRHKNLQLQVEGTSRTVGWQVGDEVKIEIPGATSLVPALVTGKGKVHVEA